MNVIFNILTDFLSWSRDTGEETNKQKMYHYNIGIKSASFNTVCCGGLTDL